MQYTCVSSQKKSHALHLWLTLLASLEVSHIFFSSQGQSSLLSSFAVLSIIYLNSCHCYTTLKHTAFIVNLLFIRAAEWLKTAHFHTPEHCTWQAHMHILWSTLNSSYLSIGLKPTLVWCVLQFLGVIAMHNIRCSHRSRDAASGYKRCSNLLTLV